MMHTSEENVDVAIIGGGLAGISAAASLARQGASVQLLEARRRLGGRVGSFEREVGGQTVEIDYCQHVSMGCCSHLRQLIESLGLESYWDHFPVYHFAGPDGRRVDLGSFSWLSPPLHLTPWLMRWPGLTLGDRVSIAYSILRLRLSRSAEISSNVSAEQWLRQTRATTHAIDRFWEALAVSALGASLRYVSFASLHMLITTAFLSTRKGYELIVPTLPLSELFSRRGADALSQMGVKVKAEQRVQNLTKIDSGWQISTPSQRIVAKCVVLAVPWHQLDKLNIVGTPPADIERLQSNCSKLKSSPITGIHTWWSDDWLQLPHVAIVGRLCQWLFSKPTNESGSFYCQVVISGSEDLTGWSKEKVRQSVLAELHELFPASRASELLRMDIVTDPQAVFVASSDSISLRPSAEVLGNRLVLAGDWTDTGWPATMEGAARSGTIAATSVMRLLRGTTG